MQVAEVRATARHPDHRSGRHRRPHDALEFMIAGATTVGVGTALFYDPLVCTKINAGIAEYLAANGMASVGELVGSLDAPKKTIQACYC